MSRLISREEQRRMGAIRSFDTFVPPEDPEEDIIKIEPITPINPTILGKEEKAPSTTIKVVYETSKYDAAKAFLVRTLPPSFVAGFVMAIAAFAVRASLDLVLMFSFLCFLITFFLMNKIDMENSPEHVAKEEQWLAHERLMRQEEMRAEALEKRINNEKEGNI